MSILTYNGQNIEQREHDGYVNATQMCQANGKTISHWFATDDYNRYADAISKKLGIPRNSLTVRTSEGFPAKKTTWVHPELAIKLARWISVEFELWCDEHIKTLITTGRTEITPQPKLPSRVVALETARAVAEIQNIVADNNPRLAQFLIDHAISDIMPSTPTLTGDRLRGVVEIAESLGYKVDMNNRCQLGKFVKAYCGELAQTEERLVNGTLRQVACYPENNTIVQQAILEFFNC